ncbi:MAG: hypothetical protein JWQ67_650 [Marmoricola sp.]|jgi:hypothetical protein|nr:hypothetical protein [Marmoricola sp.]MCW2827034.1 hypothetical protein [Marmoricola sp.]
MTCLMCKNHSVEAHCSRTQRTCAWYRCLSCNTVVDVARRLAWLPRGEVVRLG